VELLESGQRRATKMIQGLELSFFSLKERRFQGNLIVVFQYLKRVHRHEGKQLFYLGRYW